MLEPPQTHLLVWDCPADGNSHLFAHGVFHGGLGGIGGDCPRGNRDTGYVWITLVVVVGRTLHVLASSGWWPETSDVPCLARRCQQRRQWEADTRAGLTMLHRDENEEEKKATSDEVGDKANSAKQKRCILRGARLGAVCTSPRFRDSVSAHSSLITGPELSSIASGCDMWSGGRMAFIGAETAPSPGQPKSRYLEYFTCGRHPPSHLHSTGSLA